MLWLAMGSSSLLEIRLLLGRVGAACALCRTAHKKGSPVQTTRHLVALLTAFLPVSGFMLPDPSALDTDKKCCLALTLLLCALAVCSGGSGDTARRGPGALLQALPQAAPAGRV